MPVKLNFWSDNLLSAYTLNYDPVPRKLLASRRNWRWAFPPVQSIRHFTYISSLPSRQARICGKIMILRDEPIAWLAVNEDSSKDGFTTKQEDLEIKTVFVMMEAETGKNEEFADLISSDRPIDNFLSGSISSRNPCRYFFERTKSLLSSGVFLKAAAFAVGFWNPGKGFRGIMAAIVLLLDVYYLFEAVYYAFVCGHFDTPLDPWMCANVSATNSSSTGKVTLPELLHGVELISILSLVSCFAAIMSNAAFFWCMWNLKQRSEHCVTLDQSYSAAGRSLWVTLNLTMLIFGSCLVIKVLWFNLTFTGPLVNYVSLSLGIIPCWSILTSCWIFSVMTNAMKDCVTSCHAEILNATNSSLNDVIRIHKRLCKQISCTSESLKPWFVIHWFLLAITAVIYVADMVDFFQKNASEWYDLYQDALVSAVYLYVFVYPSYCAASVTARCNQMLKELNMTSDEDWETGHPFHSRAQLALFIQYAQFTDCGFQAGEVTFGSNFAWFSTLVAMCGVGVKVLW